MRHTNEAFWDNNDRYVSGEMSQTQRVLWVVTMVLMGAAMMVALWFCSR
jgi:hypothetical protein